jgi:hypothetical protein
MLGYLLPGGVMRPFYTPKGFTNPSGEQPTINIAELSPPKLRSSLPAVDIGGFFSAVNDALKLHVNSQKWPAGTNPTFVHEFPKERLATLTDPFDVITFAVGGAELAASSNDGSRVPRGPVFRDAVTSEKLFGYKNVTMAWKEEVAVMFHVWSRSNRRADDMVNWFHRFMMRYAFYYEFFKARGVDRFQFVKRGRDEVDNPDGKEIYKRSLVYQIRIEYLDVLVERELDTVTLNIGVANEDPSVQRIETIERP